MDNARIAVKVSRTVEEVLRGYEYRGTLAMGGVLFEYHVTLPEHIRSLEPTDFDPPDFKESQRLFVLELKQDGAVLELTDFEWKNFHDLISGIIGNIYRGSEDRWINPDHDEEVHHFGDLLARMHTERFGCIFSTAA